MTKKKPLPGQIGVRPLAVHRRANSMAHIRQKFALGAIGGFGLVFGLVQGVGRPLILVDLLL